MNKPEPTILDLVKETIAENRSVNSLKPTVEMMKRWAEEDISGFTSVSPERDAKFLQTLNDAVEAMKLIEDHEAMIAEKVKGAVKRFKIGTRLRVIADQIDWGGESTVPIGLVGTVASKSKYPYPEAPKGKTAVRFKASDVGYEMDDDYPEDHSENTIIYYLWNFTLEIAEPGAQSVVPPPRVWAVNPAPEGQRWAIIYDDDNGPRELGGHCCKCHEEMVEYTEKCFGRIELRPRHTEGYDMLFQVLV